MGKGVLVAAGVNDAAGVAVDAGEKEVQETKKKEERRKGVCVRMVFCFAWAVFYRLLINK
ncbi:MAG: hypothetical protein IPN96_05495 [Anaerolineales bacterium]|nr:hypothetical protein [Anaerolineales bacterium]